MQGDGNIRMRTKGEVKGGGTEKTEKEKEKEIAISTCPLSVSIQATICALPERASEGGSTLSTAHRVIKPGKQPVVCCLWVPNPQV